MRRIAATLVILAASSALVAQGQQPNRALALRPLRGVVVDAAGAGGPLRRVRIDLTAAGVSSDAVFTDNEGRFELLVPEGAHTLTFARAGFVRQAMVRPAAAIDAPLTVRLVPGAAITGRVADRFGDPAIGRVRIRGADREVMVDTDPLGDFRIGGLPAGRYEVAVVAGFRPTAQPDLSQPPVTVTVTAGEEAAAAVPPMQLGINVGPQDQGRTASPRATDTAIVRGRVVGPSGLPAGGTGVYLAGTGTERRSFITDTNGQFTFDGLPADSYALTARKTGPSYFSDEAEARVVVRQGQVIENVALAMTRAPLIAGIVVDPHGEPLEGITVELWQRRSGNGRALLLPLNDATTRSRTDDRGRYRLLAGPGSYYVVATDDRATDRSTAGNGEGAVRVYYPGTSVLTDALPVRTEWGRDAPSTDLTFAARATGGIQGFALDAAGRPLNAPITLLDSVRSGVPTPSPRTAAVGADGAFSFADVPAGDYVLQAMVSGHGGRAAEFSLTYVTLADGDTAPVSIRTTAGTTLSGRIVAESGGLPAQVRTFGLSVQTTDGDYIGLGRSMPAAVVAEDGSFEVAGLHGPLRFTGSAPPGWWLESVNIGVVDAAEHPFTFGGTPTIANVDAVFANTAGEVSGRVVDRGSRVTDYSVLVFSTDRNRWWVPSGYVKLARPSPPDGRFRALSMPPGDYLAVAVDRFDINTEWADPEVLATLAPLARRLTVREREVVTTDLDLVRRPR